MRLLHGDGAGNSNGPGRRVLGAFGDRHHRSPWCGGLRHRWQRTISGHRQRYRLHLGHTATPTWAKHWPGLQRLQEAKPFVANCGNERPGVSRARGCDYGIGHETRIVGQVKCASQYFAATPNARIHAVGVSNIELMCYPSKGMFRVFSAIFCVLLTAPALAVTGNAPAAAVWAARPIVMIVNARDDLCTGTALARDLVLTAAHCVARPVDYQIKAYQTGIAIPARTIVRHPRFDYASYAASRATADVALIKLAAPLPDVVVPATLASPRRVEAGETLTIAGFGVTLAGTARGLGTAAHGDAQRHRQARLAADPPLRPRDTQSSRRAWRLHRRFRRAGL